MRFAVGASDLNNDALIFSYLFDNPPLPRQNTAQLREGYFEWQSAPGDKGIYPIIFSVYDGVVVVSVVTMIVIGDTVFNTPPAIITTPPSTARAGILYEYQPEAVDEESGVLVWELIGNRPEGMKLDSITGRILWVPSNTDVSSGLLILKVYDSDINPKCDSQRILISVENYNRPPVALSRSVAIPQDVPCEIRLFASDADDPVLTFEIVGMPANGIAIFKSNEVVFFTPAPGFKGVDTIRFIARDAVQQAIRQI